MAEKKRKSLTTLIPTKQFTDCYKNICFLTSNFFVDVWFQPSYDVNYIEFP